MNVLANLAERKLASPPDWLPANTAYLTTMGSVAYGVAEDYSDMDVYGFALPPKVYVFPHLYGYVQGFGPQAPKFDQYQQHHVFDPDRKREYDFSVYNVVRYFELVADMNPNMVDSLFTAQDCVLFMTQVGSYVRDNRHAFLSKKVWVKFRGYAKSQLHKLRNQKSDEGKRAERVREMGFDTKNAYHVVRLLLEAEQLLMYGDLDLRRDRETLKAVRRGEVDVDWVNDFFERKEKHLDDLYANTALPDAPDYEFLKRVLLNALEMHYGSLENAVAQPDKYRDALLAVNKLVQGAL